MKQCIDKPIISEIIIVEGRDDTAAINNAVIADTIETHGFGISGTTWELISKAEREKGIIIFTDPDFAGEEIRRRLMERFPLAKEAFLSKGDAVKDGDIGIENARPDAIIEALSKACFTAGENRTEFSKEDLHRYGLTGCKGAAEARDKLGKAMGIGYGNSASFLSKLNKYNITREEFEEYFKGVIGE